MLVKVTRFVREGVLSSNSDAGWTFRRFHYTGVDKQGNNHNFISGRFYEYKSGKAGEDKWGRLLSDKEPLKVGDVVDISG